MRPLLLPFSGFLLAGCSLVADFPADCTDDLCPDGLTCDGDGVQCRTRCARPEDCRLGFGCNLASGTCTELEIPQPDVGVDAAPDADVQRPDVDLRTDTDGDGIPDDLDVCPEHDDPEQEDRDGDGRGDVCDNCLRVPNPDQEDPDQDGRGSACDNCPVAGNPSQDDRDEDGLGDVCDNCARMSNENQEDRDSDGLGDACDPCPDFGDPSLTARDCTVEEEAPEPNGHEGASQHVGLPGVVRGSLGPAGQDVYSPSYDLDLYRVHLALGDVLQVRVRATAGDLVPRVRVRPVGRDGPAREDTARDAGDVTLRVLATRAGQWLVGVSDAAGAGSEEGHDYEMMLARVDLTGPSVPTPHQEDREGPGHGGLDTLRLRAGDERVVEVAVAPEVGLAPGSTLHVLAEEDGRILGAGDVRVLAWLRQDQPAVVVWTPGHGQTTGRVGWTVAGHAPPGPEPSSDGPPRPLISGGPSTEGSLSGADRDRHVFSLSGAAGEVFRALAAPLGATRPRLALTLKDPDGQLLRRALPATNGVTHLEGVFPGDGLLLLDVGDQPGTAPPGDGPARRYALSLEALSTEPGLVSPPGARLVALDRPGALGLVTVPSSSDRWVSVTASSHGGALVSDLQVLAPGGGLLARGLGHVGFRPPEHRGYVVAVGDLLGRGGAGPAVEVSAQAVRVPTHREANDSLVAVEVGLLPREVQGTLDSASEPADLADEYKVTVPVRGAIVAWPGAIPEVGVPPAVRVTVLDEAGVEVLAAGEPGQATPPVPARQGHRYLVRVELEGPGRADYSVHVDGVVCSDPEGAPAAEPGDVAVEEVFGAAGDVDANGDGAVDTSDRFLELVGAGAGPVHAGGCALYGSEERRLWLPCGLVLRPERPVLFFAGGAPWGEFGGAAIWTVTWGDLPEAGDGLRLLDPVGVELLDVAPGLAVPGVSRNRDGEGWADHGTLAGATGPASPGTRPDGSTWSAGSSCVDDRDCVGVETCELTRGQDDLVRRCVARVGIGAPGRSCDGGDDCASGSCGPPSPGGASACRAPCQDDRVCGQGARCYQDEHAFRIDGPEPGRTDDDVWLAVAGCAPDRGAEAECAGPDACPDGEVCVPVPTGDRTAWRSVCRTARGDAPAGTECAGDDECASGLCARDVPGVAGAICLGTCSVEGDCLVGGCTLVALVTDDNSTPDPSDDRTGEVRVCAP